MQKYRKTRQKKKKILIHIQLCSHKIIQPVRIVRFFLEKKTIKRFPQYDIQNSTNQMRNKLA